jgi:hypothetical protein
MTPSCSAKKGLRYRYYVCSSAQKRGWRSCPSKSIPAAQIDSFVVEQIRQLALDPQRLQSLLADIQPRTGPSEGHGEARETPLEREESSQRLAAILDARWDDLTTQDQCRVVQALVERVEYSGIQKSVAITLRPQGIEDLATALSLAKEEQLR